MGKQVPGKKINRKHMIRFANEQHRIAERNLRAVQNAVMANANMQQILQHEMCVCSHGATKHWDSTDRMCVTEGCTCQGWKSLWSQAFEAWKLEIPNEVAKLNLDFSEEEVAAVIATIDLPAWFDANVKPVSAAQRVKERLEKPEEATEEGKRVAFPSLAGASEAQGPGERASEAVPAPTLPIPADLQQPCPTCGKVGIDAGWTSGQHYLWCGTCARSYIDDQAGIQVTEGEADGTATDGTGAQAADSEA